MTVDQQGALAEQCETVSFIDFLVFSCCGDACFQTLGLCTLSRCAKASRKQSIQIKYEQSDDY